ncbi:GNAT family N-acetyltransferase [Mycoplasmatota bacterium]|nr:GNAT family N-acetyltransferase [Mycoplasmatota bacterium]
MRINDGRIVEIRNTKVSDASDLLDFFAKTVIESDALTTAPGEVSYTVEEEEKIIMNWIENKSCNNLLCLYDGRIIGICGLHGTDKRKRIKHMSSLGITVAKEFWGLGIGYFLIQEQIRYAKEVGLKKIDLEVRCDNKAGIHLYKKCGFEIEGTHRCAAYIDGIYKDNYYMGIIIY